VFCQLLQDVEFSQPLHAMENESEKNNNQIVLFKTVTHNISDLCSFPLKCFDW
jgi:hypothetical protein